MPSESNPFGASRIWSRVTTVLILISEPFLTGWTLTRAKHVFTGARINRDDLSVYHSEMCSGSAGYWRFYSAFTLETWESRLMLLPYSLTEAFMESVGGVPLM